MEQRPPGAHRPRRRGEITTNTWVEYDLSGTVLADGAYSFVLVAQSTDGVDFHSRDNASNQPQLVLTVDTSGPPPTPTPTPIPPTPTPTPTATPPPTVVTITAEADADVNEANPGTNYGTNALLRIDGGADPDREGYLRFTVSGVSGTVESAKLRLFCLRSTVDGPAVHLGRSTMAGRRRRSTGTTGRPTAPRAIADVAGVSTNTWVEYDVSSAVAANGTYTFVLLPQSTDGVDFHSRENATIDRSWC